MERTGFKKQEWQFGSHTNFSFDLIAQSGAAFLHNFDLHSTLAAPEKG
jgi:hypothetical protein